MKKRESRENSESARRNAEESKPRREGASASLGVHHNNNMRTSGIFLPPQHVPCGGVDPTNARADFDPC